MTKKKIGLLSLSFCGGCQRLLLDHSDKILNILDDIEIGFFPIVVDTKEIPELDILLVDGTVRTWKEHQKLIDAREKAKTLVAYGTCSAFGGLMGLESMWSNEELLNSLSYDPGVIKGDLTLDKRVYPIDTIVDVDYYVPGCPPKGNIIYSFLASVLKGEEPRRIDLPVCAECTRVVKHEHEGVIKRPHEVDIDPEECLLSQGIVCLGSVSRGGCGAPCSIAGVSCLGCRGPSDKVFLNRTIDMYQELVDRIARLTGAPKEDIKEQIYEIPRLFYTFTFSNPDIRKKPTSRISEFIYRIWLNETEQVEET